MENENIKLNLPPFYVGQRVLSLGSNKESGLSSDKVYQVTGIKRVSCKCGNWVISIGLVCHTPSGICAQCNSVAMVGDGYYWFDVKFFAPIEERFISLAEVIKIESPLTGVN